ncbi:unnamed protein product [Brassica oleracea]|uniref:Uncharacterized protein n=1 Tax=Brassica oleracea TaxID=3712 RepID=A0A3P6DQ32_BRAOL|nr:unnamed protein product [Brassica oleracea]
MRNNIIFNNKRDHIINMINGALRDLDQWREANKNTGDEEQNRQNKSLSKISIKDKLPPNSEYYCLVDASWNLFDELNQFKTEQTNRNVRITEAVLVPQDIFEISKHRDYTFHYLSRDNLNVVDSLAKQARLNKKNYVVSWKF